MEKDILGWVTVVLVIVGAINWGLVGAVNFNLVNLIFGSIEWLESMVYVLVGISGVWEAVLLFKD
jgi:uncharacterized protein